MLYVRKPIPVEAVLIDGPQTVVDFLREGEFSVIANNEVGVVVNGSLVMCPYGEWYAGRDDFGLFILQREEFETTFLPMTSAELEFNAFGSPEDGFSLQCGMCGEFARSSDEEEFFELASAHVRAEHKELLG